MLPLALAASCTSSPSTDGPPGANARAAPSQGSPVVDNLPEVSPDPRDRILADITSRLLPQKHLLRRPIDDTLSREAFPQYIEELDGAKLYLLQGDVDKLSAYADRMDDELRGHDLVLARKGAALAAERRAKVAVMVAEILARPFDFTVAGDVETDPKKLAFCKTEPELRERWNAVLKLQALERIKQMEDLLEAKGAAQARPRDPSARGPVTSPDSAVGPDQGPVPEPLADIPSTFEAREEKARKELATRFETRFARDAAPAPLDATTKFLNAIAASYDPHTQYLAPADKKNFDIAITGTVEGIGALLGERDHYIVVQEVVPGGAAWQDGRLEQGDSIVSVAQEGKPAVDATDMPIDKVVDMIRGPKGSVVILTVKKADGSVHTISIKRDVVRIEAAYARGAVLDLGPKHEPVGYVYLPGFYGDIGGPGRPGERNATDDVRALLAGFEKKKLAGAIVDLRGNGGGLLLHARDIAGLFIERGPIVQVRDSDGRQEVLSDEDPAVAFSGNLVVLVDRFSASASEIVAGALQDYERAVIVGTGPTHGKGTVQTVLDLDQLIGAPGGDSLGVFKLTVQQYFRVNGASTQWRGVTPDIVLPDPVSFVESGERSLPHSIPWTSVRALDYARRQHGWSIPALAAASRERVKANPVFGKIEAFGKLMQERRRNTREPVERNAFLAERKRDKQARDAIDPDKSELKPYFEVSLVPGPSSAAAKDDKKLRQRLDAWKDNLARDAWVSEAVHIAGNMAGEE